MGEVKTGALSQSFGIIGEDFNAQFAPYTVWPQYPTDR
jgi:hypothetical protein